MILERAELNRLKKLKSIFLREKILILMEEAC